MVIVHPFQGPEFGIGTSHDLSSASMSDPDLIDYVFFRDGFVGLPVAVFFWEETSIVVLFRSF